VIDERRLGDVEYGVLVGQAVKRVCANKAVDERGLAEETQDLGRSAGPPQP
jgi:hypothetical protein